MSVGCEVRSSSTPEYDRRNRPLDFDDMDQKLPAKGDGPSSCPSEEAPSSILSSAIAASHPSSNGGDNDTNNNSRSGPTTAASASASASAHPPILPGAYAITPSLAAAPPTELRRQAQVSNGGAVEEGGARSSANTITAATEVTTLPTVTAMAWPVDDNVEVGVAIEADGNDGHISAIGSGRSRGSNGKLTMGTSDDGAGCLIHVPRRTLLVLACALVASIAVIGGVLATRNSPANAEQVDTSDAASLLTCPSTKLHPTIGRNADHFGYAIDGEEDTVLIGAFASNILGENSGAAYIFRRNTEDNSWFEEAMIYPDDGVARDMFGVHVALDETENLAVIGADQAGSSEGAVYVYERNDRGSNSSALWTQKAKLMADDTTEGAQFGDSVDIQGDTIVVGASYPDVPITGAVYVFEKDVSSSSWVQTHKLVPGDENQHHNSAESRFGRSVALAGNTLVVGSDKDSPNGHFSGSAYIFRKTEDPRSNKGQKIWVEEAKIYPDDGGPSQYFGYAVDIDANGNTAVVSSWKDGAVATPATEAKAAKTEQIGAVYTFSRSVEKDENGLHQWKQQAKIIAEDGEPGDRFGNNISINGGGDALLVGAYHDDDRRGSAYLFRRGIGGDASSWTQRTKLRADDVNTYEEFANQVILGGSRVFIGENKDGDNGYEAGAVHVYEMDKCIT